MKVCVQSLLILFLLAGCASPSPKSPRPSGGPLSRLQLVFPVTEAGEGMNRSWAEAFASRFQASMNARDVATVTTFYPIRSPDRNLIAIKASAEHRPTHVMALQLERAMVGDPDRDFAPSTPIEFYLREVATGQIVWTSNRFYLAARAETKTADELVAQLTAAGWLKPAP